MRSSTAKGVTLVEVIAGLALIGSLLSVIIVSSSQHLRQLKAAQRKRVSVEILDDFLSSWSISDFSTDGIAGAVERSGVDVRGYLGEFRLQSAARPERTGYKIQLKQMEQSGLPNSVVVRATVRAPHGERSEVNGAWAEVMVPE